MADTLFEIALKKRKISLLEQLIPYQHLTSERRAAIIKQFMSTKNTFVMPLIHTLESKEDIQACLYPAIFHKKVDAVKLLLEKGANPNKRSEYGQIPFHYAVSTKEAHRELIEALIQYGADVNVKNKYSATPISLAASYGNLELLQLLEEKGATINEDVLRSAATSSRFEVVNYLLKKGIPVTHKVYFMVMMMNKKEMANYLFQYDPLFKLTPTPNYNVLSIAACKNYLDLILKMMKRGLPEDEEEKKMICSTALIAAIDSGHLHLLPIFFEHGADINCIIDDETPLDVARYNRNTAIIKWIKERGGVSSGIKKLPI
ncbi:ankyrin repeat domain-containing protein [Litchfieldia alkalitelluris]|uniref:ankyrin repeat domain-containing protein n=1 Tax=Litchfieldia alkalitelluris TaxID=304268 RepID=UPI0009963477|nr:ankyrin repeat domain-containing protein [Litchfieldia alkalitelluris]